MTTVTKEIERVPAFRVRVNKHGIEIATRAKYVGFAFQAGWMWVDGAAFTIFGWDVYCSGKKFFNGPRSWAFGTISGFLRLRFGMDAILFTGKRDPAIQTQIDAAQALLHKAAQTAIAAELAKTIEVAAPLVSITDSSGLLV
jgi:hypothetical protein